MKKSIFVLVAVTAIACAGAPSEDATGPKKVSSAIVSPGSRVLWRDATNAVVPVVRIDNDGANGLSRVFFLHQDSVWVHELDPLVETGNPYRVAPVQTGELVYYLSSDCTGPKCVQSFLVTAIGGATTTLDGQHYYRYSNTVAPEWRADLQSIGTPENCGVGPFRDLVVPFDSMTQVTKPDQPFVGPLHPDLIAGN